MNFLIKTPNLREMSPCKAYTQLHACMYSKAELIMIDLCLHICLFKRVETTLVEDKKITTEHCGVKPHVLVLC